MNDTVNENVNVNEKMKTSIERLLKFGGIKFKDCWWGGSHGLLTFYSEAPARRAANLFARASFHVRFVAKDIDYAKINRGSQSNPSKVIVWRLSIRA